MLGFTQPTDFWADPSRELIDTIDKIETLQRKLKKSEYSFKVNEYNQNIITHCKTFLKSSYGSTIPENMDRIDLYYAEPIFIKDNVINVKRAESTSTNNLIPLGAGSYALTYKYHDDFYDKNFVVKRLKKTCQQRNLNDLSKNFKL